MARICPNCGTANDSRVTFCGACAMQLLSTSTALVRARSGRLLPVLSQREQATVGGIVLGLAAVALRVGTAVLKQLAEQQQPAQEPPPAAERPQGTVIRRRWVVGDRNGPVRWGEEEIEVQRGSDEHGSYRVWLGGPK